MTYRTESIPRLRLVNEGLCKPPPIGGVIDRFLLLIANPIPAGNARPACSSRAPSGVFGRHYRRALGGSNNGHGSQAHTPKCGVFFSVSFFPAAAV
jgi:hypothetical protein